MLRVLYVLVFALGVLAATVSHAGRWAAPRSPVIPGASGYVVIPGVAVPPRPARVYRAIFEATRAADRPGQLAPAIDNAASELNAFGVAGVPAANVKLVLVFHGPAMDALLDDAHYRAKHGVANPNLAVLAGMKRHGVKLFVCGQNLAADDVDPATLTRDVVIASDALIVLMTYENDGYALLSF